MPKTTRDGRVKAGELPSTLRRSPARAQQTFARTHDSAAEQYGEGTARRADGLRRPQALVREGG